MFGFWELQLNRKQGKAINMNLESILSGIKVSDNSFTLNN